MTYNIHSCIGAGGSDSRERVARVVEAFSPDVLALQEVDAGQARTGRVHQGAWLAERLSMHHLFSSARETDGGHYGNAVLSRYPLSGVRDALLPRYLKRKLEPRVAQWAKIYAFGRELHLVNTHLSLHRKERLLQAKALLGSDWLLHPDCAGPLFVCGDLNSLPWSTVYRTLRHRLWDVHGKDRGVWTGRTFPSRFPLFRLDYIFASAGLRGVPLRFVPTHEMRRASDHLPLLATFELPEPSMPLSEADAPENRLSP